jgi:ketosteroid isomerase-like protein
MLLSLALMPAGIVAAQTPPAQPPPANSAQRDQEIIQRLEEEYLRAEIEDDTAIAGSILADDYVGLRPDGTATTKADILSRLNLHQRQRQPYQITAENMRVHLFGDTAGVTYSKVYVRPGKQGAFSENIFHVLLRRNGIWRIQMSTVLPSPRAETPAP